MTATNAIHRVLAQLWQESNAAPEVFIGKVLALVDGTSARTSMTWLEAAFEYALEQLRKMHHDRT